MTNAELIKALRYHADATIYYCDGCPYQTIHKTNGMCIDRIISDAADALEEMSNDIEKHYIPLLESWQKRAQSRLLKIQEMKKETEELLSETANVVKINELLKAQLPKEGEWIMDCLAPQMDAHRIGQWAYAPKCSECGTHWDAKTNYCPNCGAKMKTVTDCHTLEEGER